MLVEKVMERMKQLECSKTELIERSGVNKNSVYNFLAGGSISIESLEKILEAVGLEVRPVDSVDYERKQAEARLADLYRSPAGLLISRLIY